MPDEPTLADVRQLITDAYELHEKTRTLRARLKE
jgi:hypothetical protein